MIWRMTMCVWRHFGTAGSLETQNYLCLLSTNIIIEKIFVFLWFWLIFLLLSSLCNFLYYSMLILSKNENVRKVQCTTNITFSKLIFFFFRNYFLAFAVRTSKKKLRWEDKKVKHFLIKTLNTLYITWYNKI